MFGPEGSRFIVFQCSFRNWEGAPSCGPWEPCVCLWQSQSLPGLAVSTQKWRVLVRWEPQELWSWAFGGSEGVDTRDGDFWEFLALQVCQTGFGLLSLWGAVGGDTMGR